MGKVIIGTSVVVLIFGGMSAKAQTPKSPELKVLDHLVGSWRNESVVTQANGDEEESTDTSVAKWSLQGRHIEERGTDSDGKETFLGLWTYDSDAGVYKTWIFAPNLPIPIPATLQWDESKKTLAGKGDLGNGITMQITLWRIDNDRSESTATMKDASGNVLFDFKGKSFRKSDRLPIESPKAQTPKSLELKVLDRFVGSWRLEQVERQANGDEEKGTATLVTKWSLQGRYIEIRATDSDGKEGALELWTYDSDAGVYKMWFFDSNSPEPKRGTLRWNESKKTLTSANEDVGNGITGQLSVRFIDNDRTEYTVTAKDASENVVFETKGKLSRKK